MSEPPPRVVADVPLPRRTALVPVDVVVVVDEDPLPRVTAELDPPDVDDPLEPEDPDEPDEPDVPDEPDDPVDGGADRTGCCAEMGGEAIMTTAPPASTLSNKRLYARISLPPDPYSATLLPSVSAAKTGRFALIWAVYWPR